MLNVRNAERKWYGDKMLNVIREKFADEVINNYKEYCARQELYLKFGYDSEKERQFIIENAIPIDEEILDIGTGKGYLAVELARKGYYFSSIDIDDECLHIARLNLKYFSFESNVKITKQNAEQLSFKDNSFNTVFMINTLHHLKHPYKVLSEIIRVISIQGKLVIGDFSEEGFEFMDKIHSMEGKTHERGKVSLKDIERYLLNKGFLVENFSSKFQNIIIIKFW